MTRSLASVAFVCAWTLIVTLAPRPVRHFINLTNGLEALPLLQSGATPAFSKTVDFIVFAVVVIFVSV